MVFTVWTRSGFFFGKIVPRSFSDRFLLQNGSQKAPQNGPKWTLEASFLSVVFPPTFYTVLAPILGPFWAPKWSLEASFLRVVFSYVFWTVLGLILGAKNGPGGGRRSPFSVLFSSLGSLGAKMVPKGAPRAPKGAPEGAQGPPKWSFWTILDLILEHFRPHFGQVSNQYPLAFGLPATVP